MDHTKFYIMKKNIFLSILLTSLFVVSNSTAQKFPSLDKSPLDIAAFPSSYKNADKNIRITYSRPQLTKGDLKRKVYSLAKPSKVWRTGANETPEIIFYKDANFGGKKVKAGTYSLLTIPGKNEWTVILNKNLNQWGHYTYDDNADVSRIIAKTSHNKEEHLEAFSIAFTNETAENMTKMIMGWGSVRVTIPITFNPSM